MNDRELDRFLLRIAVDEHGCWLWIGEIHERGYGRLRAKGRNVRAHRLSFEHFAGPIPEGLEIDHLCRVRHCVNPDHLEAVTHAENMRRAGPYQPPTKPPLTHCRNGHPYEGDNLKLVASGRRCRQCRRDRKQRFRQSLKNADRSASPSAASPGSSASRTAALPGADLPPGHAAVGRAARRPAAASGGA